MSVDNTVSPPIWRPVKPIIKGEDWGGSSGHQFTSSQSLSGSTLEIIFYNNKGQEIIRLNETNEMIYKSSSTVFYLSIERVVTGALPKGAITGRLISTTGDIKTSLFIIETEVIE